MKARYENTLLSTVPAAQLRRFLDKLEDEERPYEITVKRIKKGDTAHAVAIDCNDVIYFSELLSSCK